MPARSNANEQLLSVFIGENEAKRGVHSWFQEELEQGWRIVDFKLLESHSDGGYVRGFIVAHLERDEGRQ